MIGSFRLRTHCASQTSLELKSKRTQRGFPRPSVLASPLSNRTKGTQEQVAPLFLGLNTPSSLQMLSIGCRRANATQGNTNYPKEFFDKQFRDLYQTGNCSPKPKSYHTITRVPHAFQHKTSHCTLLLYLPLLFLCFILVFQACRFEDEWSENQSERHRGCPCMLSIL